MAKKEKKTAISEKGEKNDDLSFWQKAAVGTTAGFVNGFFGSCGGIFAIILMQLWKVEAKKTHALSVGIILPICVVSAAGYALRGQFQLVPSLIYIPFGLVGSAVGVFLLKKISVRWLKMLFAALLIYSGILVLVKGFKA